MKGIILAGGSGTRLYPITIGVSKQLLPVYDKPMIYYPLSVLMLGGIRDILIITTPHDSDQFKRLLGDGSQIGVNIEYAVQEEPKGIAQAFIIGEKFIGNDSVTLILGDNIFYGAGFTEILRKSMIEYPNSAKIFGYRVHDPERYGVAEITESGMVKSIEEKPKFPKSDLAVVGLYIYPNSVVNIAKNLKPSKRGELEITDINKEYLNQHNIYLNVLPRGMAWLDTGTISSLNEASNFVCAIQNRQGIKIACLEEIAYKNLWLNNDDMYVISGNYKNNEYGKYIERLVVDNKINKIYE